MPSDMRATLREIRTFPSLLKFLRDELDWPVDASNFDDATFEYDPEELGIDAKHAPKIQEIRRLRAPDANDYPWGIFFIKFAPKRLPVMALRRILNSVVRKKRAATKGDERKTWTTPDLLFISSYGEENERQITFAHFKHDEGAPEELPVLRVLGWDNKDTALHLDDVADTLTGQLRWPDNDSDHRTWRKSWSDAFQLRHLGVIRTSRALAEELAKLARIIRDRIRTAFNFETDTGPLTKLMRAFQTALIHDLDADGFADMYAQTIAYGLLSARIADPKNEGSGHFTAHMKTNPFLGELMEEFFRVGGGKKRAGGLGIDFDEIGVADVVDLLDDPKTHLDAVLSDFGSENPEKDPVTHFYEGFLKAYDPKLKFDAGVFYTPLSVVHYIVRSIHEILQTEFDLPDGLADTATWGEVSNHLKLQKLPDGVSKGDRFVTILDPATGTGTVLVEVIDIIHKTLLAKWEPEHLDADETEARWNAWVPKHLLPRLCGYELLMAPYAIAHLKIGLKLHETGYRFASTERARVYLTNALQPADRSGRRPGEAFSALATEAAAVNEVKLRGHFSVVLGNPPYAQYSNNMAVWAKAHIDKFRYANGSRIKARNMLQLERNLNDDYVKFLGLAIDLFPSGTGAFGMITNRVFLESDSLVGLREWFATRCCRLTVVDLWGSSEESQRVPRLALDKPVFDIEQGVSVMIGARRDDWPVTPCQVSSYELIGSRASKYEWLAQHTGAHAGGSRSIVPARPSWSLTNAPAPTAQDLTLDQVFPSFSTLVASNRDHLVVGFDQPEILERVRAVQSFSGTDEEMCARFEIALKKGWNIAAARAVLRSLPKLEDWMRVIEYRPFDRRQIFFHPTLVWQTAPVTSSNLLTNQHNRVLISLGKNRSETTNGHWVSLTLADKSVVSTRDNASGFPLYLYAAEGGLGLSDRVGRPNLSSEFLTRLSAQLGLALDSATTLPFGVTADDVFNYVYALISCPSYRTRHAALLVAGFPPIPIVRGLQAFRALASLGDLLVSVQLLERESSKEQGVAYWGKRDTKIDHVGWLDDTVWLDATGASKRMACKIGTAGFRGIPRDVWDFHVGTVPVCFKWLDNRKGRTLSADDITHYQKIIVAIQETIRIMAEIDKVIEAHGGWPGAFQPTAGSA
jgi:hypothetical protein